MAKKKEITIDELAKMMNIGFARTEKSTDDKIEDLAVMVKQGFDGVDEKFNEIRSQMATKNDLEKLATKADLNNLARAIKDIEMHMSSDSSYSREQIDHLRDWMEGINARVTALETTQLGKK